MSWVVLWSMLGTLLQNRVVLSLESEPNQACIKALVDSSALATFAQKLKFKNSGHSDSILFARENAFAHWQLLKLISEHEVAQNPKAEDDPATLTFWLKPIGPVLGDPHIRNVEVRAIFGLNPHIRFAFNDADDAGIGPLVGDLLRLASVSKAEAIKTSSLPDFYARGLRGDEVEMPDSLRPFVKISYRKFLKRQTELFERDYERIKQALRTQSGDFNFNSGAGILRRFEGYYEGDPEAVALVARLRNQLGLRLYDKRRSALEFTKRSGGSGGIARYWILAVASEGVPYVWEFKRLSETPGVAGFGLAQLPPIERYRIATGLLYGSDAFLTYTNFTEFNGHFYLLRAKMANPLKRAVENQDEFSAKDKRALAEYSAYELGLFQNRSAGPSDEELTAMIAKHPVHFQNVIRRIRRVIDRVMNLGFEKTRVDGQR